ncbi:flagellar hook-associated protein FlgK [Desulfatitalea sp. M08but]|uniref:Flagellar hook-associated protein 1 n=1 Tax=Desulfatitalea alkaliphila TaxID=2929485 RepID=A0AA41R305_9BACT|nr:flagellar hook-associated protein FlgK [Desulfatitalea alkaliphila]
MTQQKAIDITGNNIANVNTPGYSRQRLNMEQATPVRVLNTTMSTGVVAQQKIQRFHDQFVQSQMNTENENLGRWEAQRTALEKIEVLFDEVSGYGLSTAMSGFWNSWQDLSNNPTGHVERNSVLSAGQYLTSTFNQLSKNIQNAQKDINTSINSVVTDINRMADQIAELNGKITKVEVTGHNANDYRDQRDLLVLELAKLIDIESFEDGDGNMTITVGNGKPLVERAFTWDLVTENIEGKQNVHWKDSSGNTLDITTHIQSGELKGWIEARDRVIEGYLGRLNVLAENMISEVNALHGSGYGIDDDVQRPFFVPESDGNALSIAINPEIVGNVNHIAAAGQAFTPGDNSNAIATAELQNALTMSENASTFGDFYAALVGDVGNDTRRAGLNFGHQTAMMKHLSNYREEVAGVSLDEEMVNLVQYQHAYNAAAKLITTTDELMQTLIGLVR